uniref:Uncharacterized protein n=1 Tax=Arundo donax TaxID=35708 RepID=A0A0A8ZKY2_ARUDO
MEDVCLGLGPMELHCTLFSQLNEFFRVPCSAQ